MLDQERGAQCKSTCKWHPIYNLKGTAQRDVVMTIAGSVCQMLMWILLVVEKITRKLCRLPVIVVEIIRCYTDLPDAVVELQDVV